MSDETPTPFDGPMIVSPAPFRSSSDAPALPIGSTDGITDDNASGITPSTNDEEWQEFSSALAACLADLEEDDALVISHKSSGAFVQFISHGDYGMRAEAVSNTWLPPQSQLSEANHEGLLARGSRAPTYAPPDGADAPTEGSPNYYVDAAPPVPYTDLATLATTSLRQIYRAKHPGELQYNAFDVIDRGQIRFPSLKLEREPTERVAITDSDGSPGPGT